MKPVAGTVNPVLSALNYRLSTPPPHPYYPAKEQAPRRRYRTPDNAARLTCATWCDRPTALHQRRRSRSGPWISNRTGDRLPIPGCAWVWC